MSPQPGAGVAAPPAPAAASEVERLEEQFSLLYAVLRQRFRDQAAAVDLDLQPAGLRTLTALARIGSTSPGVLAEVLGFDRSVLSRQLQQLIRLGLVVKRPDPTDGRAAVVSVTEAAQDRIAIATDRARDAFRARLGEWPAEDVAELSRLLARLTSDAGV